MNRLYYIFVRIVAVLFAGGIFAACSLFNVSLRDFLAQEKRIFITQSGNVSNPIPGLLSSKPTHVNGAGTEGDGWYMDGSTLVLTTITPSNWEIDYALDLPSTVATITNEQSVSVLPANSLHDKATVHIDKDNKLLTITFALNDITGLSGGTHDLTFGATYTITDTSGQNETKTIPLPIRMELSVPVTGGVYFYVAPDLSCKYAVGLALPTASLMKTVYSDVSKAEILHGDTVLITAENFIDSSTGALSLSGNWITTSSTISSNHIFQSDGSSLYAVLPSTQQHMGIKTNVIASTAMTTFTVRITTSDGRQRSLPLPVQMVQTGSITAKIGYAIAPTTYSLIVDNYTIVPLPNSGDPIQVTFTCASGESVNWKWENQSSTSQQASGAGTFFTPNWTIAATYAITANTTAPGKLPGQSHTWYVIVATSP
ncbi:MAG: hypothetical protein IJ191_04650 [Treponema sp.]|nr:hypothetical protein [Treponema sp.]